MSVLATALIVGGMGLVCGIALALAARFLSVSEDPRVEQAKELLPGANCGGCGFAGCADYAKAIVLDGAAINLCAPGAVNVVAGLSALLGIAAEARERQVAIVLCTGDRAKAARRFAYNGVADCGAAHAVGGGDKGCRHGCLGYGSCARVCPKGAIEITGQELAVVHPELCIGCKACVKACPRRLIKMIPESRSIHVLCSSPDKGPAVRKVCSVGCIGCTACAKLATNQEIVMRGALAVVDYDKPFDNEAVIAKCPMKTIVRRSGMAAVETAGSLQFNA